MKLLIIWLISFTAHSQVTVPVLNQKWLDSVYKVHDTPLRKGDRFLYQNDTVKLIKPIRNTIWKVKRGKSKYYVTREEILKLKRVTILL